MSAGEAWRPPLPSQVQSWFLVCRSGDVPRGRVLSLDFLGRPTVLFRGESGGVSALSAHCSHLGTHLGAGTVVGDRLRCPLHHWEYDGEGVCRRIPVTEQIPGSACQASFPVVERYGCVFVFNGAAALHPPPTFGADAEGSLRTAVARPVRLRCPWYVVQANAFDMQHLQTVHERALREAPVVQVLDGNRLRLRYVSRVTGHTAVDRTMRWLARDCIRISITCWGGSILTIESDLGRARSSLLLGFLPTEEGTRVTPVFGMRRTGLAPADALRVSLARWLYSGFLERDISLLDGTRFRPHLLLPYDASLRQYLDFIASLPTAGHRLETVSRIGSH